jgi:hypothetical protein
MNMTAFILTLTVVLGFYFYSTRKARANIKNSAKAASSKPNQKVG